MERTNARYLEALPEAIDLLVADLSFISLNKVMPAIRIAPGAQAILLIKLIEAGPAVSEAIKDPEFAWPPLIDHSRAPPIGCQIHGTIPLPLLVQKRGISKN